MHEGHYSNILGLNGIPSPSEEVMIARDILLAEYLEARIHIAHISTKRSVSLVKAAKKRKIRITAEVTPHHILLTDKNLQTYDTNFKMKPPLRGEEDKKAILTAVLDGTIDVFATDHAPHTPDEKEVEFDYAPFGIIGLETAVPLLLDKLVNPGLISLQRFVEMMSLNPATILGLKNKGRIDIGADADLTVLNLSTNHTIDSSSFFSKSRNTPFNGWTVNGIPEITIVSGKIVYKVKI
jgi:dihydroorotase